MEDVRGSEIFDLSAQKAVAAKESTAAASVDGLMIEEPGEIVEQ